MRGQETEQRGTIDMASGNFFSWLYGEKVTMDSGEFKEEEHPREVSGEGGGRFTEKPETAEKIEVGLEPPKAKATESEKPQGGKIGWRQRRDAQASKLKEDGTYDFNGNPVSYEGGFQVSFQEETTERPGHAAYIDDDEYDRRVEVLSKELNAEPNLAKFGEPEISFHVDSLDKAMEVARRHNQESIWDWSHFDVIPNPDFVGREHYADRDNHTGKHYRQRN